MSFIVLSVSSTAQNRFGFESGQIVTKQDDTIRCFIEIAVNYGSKVAYKNSIESKVLLMPSNEIRAIVTPYKYLESVQLEDKEVLMTLMIKGKVNLFNYVIIKEVERPTGYGGINSYQSDIAIFVLTKDGDSFEIKKKNFKDQMRQILNDCSSVVNKVNDGLYKFNDLDYIVLEYNSCK